MLMLVEFIHVFDAYFVEFIHILLILMLLPLSSLCLCVFLILMVCYLFCFFRHMESGTASVNPLPQIPILVARTQGVSRLLSYCEAKDMNMLS